MSGLPVNLACAIACLFALFLWCQLHAAALLERASAVDAFPWEDQAEREAVFLAHERWIAVVGRSPTVTLHAPCSSAGSDCPPGATAGAGDTPTPLLLTDNRSGASEPCAYCRTSSGPSDICASCWESL